MKQNGKEYALRLNKTTLVVYTQNFPYGKGETFLENEISHLSMAFDKVVFVPASNKIGVEDKVGHSFINSERINTLPSNCEILKLQTNQFGNYAGGKQLLKAMSFIPFVREFVHFIPLFVYVLIHDFSAFRMNPRAFTFILFNLFLRSKILESAIKSIGNNALHYSYWMYEWATILSILRFRGGIGAFFSRGHGNDVFTENYGFFELKRGNRVKQFGSYTIRYRNFELSQIQCLFVISVQMKSYMVAKYRHYKEKILVSRLGVGCRGTTVAQKNTFRIASASNVIPLKRVERIIEILSDLTFDVEWVHFGSGPLFDSLQQKAVALQRIRSNIKIRLFGRIANDQVINFYENNPISVFINLSVTEGLPVSIMEALSFGIPIIATDVGGTSEAVPENSFLIPKDFNNTLVSDILKLIHKMEASEYQKLSDASLDLFKAKFDAEKNYSEFLSEIEKCSRRVE